MRTSPYSTRIVIAGLSAALAACGGPVETPVVVFDAGFGGPDATPTTDAAEAEAGVDAGPSEAGFPDAEPADAVPVDGGFLDGSAVDAGFADSGVEPDAGFPDAEVDAGFADAEVDAGLPDAEVDAGFPDAEVDAGLPDAEVDAGSPDTGVDAGIDAGPVDTGILPPPSSYTRRLIDNGFRHGQHVSVVDVDGDNDLDVVASISLTDTVRLYLNGGNGNGNGVGATWATVQIAPNNSVVAMGTVVADFDGDLDLDVVAIGFFDRNVGFSSPGDLTLYLRGAAITDWTAVPVNVGNAYWGPRMIAAGDLTGDGLPDVVTGAVEMYDQNGSVVGHGVRWHRNTGGNLTGATDIDALLLDVEGLEVVDVDGDGVLDVVAAGRNSGQVVWYENNRAPGQVDNAPTFTRHVLANVVQPGHVAMGQLDADPALEAVVVHDDGSGGALAWYDPPANPRAAWTRNLVAANFGGSGNVLRVAIGDVNGDGAPDIVAASAITNQLRAFVRTAAGWTDQLVQNQTGADAIATGDIDRDGRDDLVGTTYENTPTADRVDWYEPIP